MCAGVGKTLKKYLSILKIRYQAKVLQEFSVPNRAKTYGNVVEMGFFCPTWTSAEVSYLFHGEVSEDTDKILAVQKCI